MYDQENKERDELRARFTKWMEITLYRARLDYLKKWERENRVILMEDIPESSYLEECNDDDPASFILSKDSFNFEDQALEQAFTKLSELKRDVLIKLFVKEKKPPEAAEILGCSLRQVYKQKEQAIAELRNLLKGEKNDGER